MDTITTKTENAMTQRTYIYHTYVLSYQDELGRFTELFSDKDEAIERLCELGRGCITKESKTVVYPLPNWQ